jgi:hypothetical protein
MSRASISSPATKDGRSKAPTDRPAPATVTAEERRVRAMLGRTLPGVVYGMALKSTFGQEIESNGIGFALDAIERMAPRDPIEEMLIAQILFAHARVVRLTSLANEQTAIDSIRVINEYADRASNTSRRLMLALAEYRRPAMPGGNLSVVQQTNIAGQQVFQNHELTPTNATNEQGCSSPQRCELGGCAAPCLPPHTAGIGFAPSIDHGGESVDSLHRPPFAGGQGPLADECDEAR